MRALKRLQKQAISLRKQGLTYSEILKQVPVAQSSISLWCRNVPLTKSQRARIEKVRNDGVKLGAVTRHNTAVKTREKTILGAKQMIENISDRELWLIGVALYWAEGSKQSAKDVSQGVKFTNSDPEMIKLFNFWLTKIMKVSSDDINYEIYLHESMSRERDQIIAYWSKILNKPREKFDRIYLKRNIITKSYPKSDYKGVVRIVVKKSANLNRQITGWQHGIITAAGSSNGRTRDFESRYSRFES